MDIVFQNKKESLSFRQPVDIISCDYPSRCGEAFRAIERALANGCYVAGFLSYEAGYHFEERLSDEKRYDFPLIYFGVYRDPVRKNRAVFPSKITAGVREIELSITREHYARHIETIREHIARGDVYQITYCIKKRFRHTGDPLLLYQRLFQEQPVPYPAYIDTGRYQILSLSPEMFIEKHGAHIVTRPMKGTWPRGGTPFHDCIARWRFQYDAKNRAENIMILDLLRNDLGKIGREVRAPRLFEVAKYRTLYQMTSTATALVDPDIPIETLFRALFPSGSVTGAPKVRAMEIIRALEGEERKIYTGAIGYISPEKDLFFNIPIRTLLIEGDKGEMGIGGGIVWDSTPDGEWDEGMLKSQFLHAAERNR